MTIERVRMSWGRSGSAFSLASFLFLAACGSDTSPGAVDSTGDNASGDNGGDSTDGTDETDGTDSASGAIDGGGGKVMSAKLDAGVKDAGSVKAADASSVTASDASSAVVKTTADASNGMPTGADAGKPTTADSGTVVDTKPDAGPPVLPPDPGKGDGKDVVTIGDSWMSNTLDIEGTGGGIYAALQRAGYRYKNYAQQGVMLLSDSALFGPAIPTQWDAATKANPNIKTVLMTAGGNDIIQDSTLAPDCKAGGTLCDDELKKIGVALVTLWNKMSAAGVQDIVHIMYAADADGGTLKKAKENAEGLMLLCSKVMAPGRCHLVATDDLAKGDYVIDTIHPTAAANDRIATAVEKFMADQHIRR